MPSAAVPKDRHESLRIAKRLNKFISLPNIRHWRVHCSDVLQRGRVLSLLRTKNTFLPDEISSLKMRQVTITKHGFLVLYETPDKGLIIDLRVATHILTECDQYKSKRIRYSRSHLKIRLPRGNVHLYVKDDDIPKWTSALLEAHINSKQVPFGVKDACVQTMAGVMEPSTAIEDLDNPATSSNSGLITDMEKSSEDSQLPSVRRGTIPVKSLREKIETKLSPKKCVAPKQKVTSMFVFHNGHASQEDAIVEEENEPQGSKKKEWWMRSLRC